MKTDPLVMRDGTGSCWTRGVSERRPVHRVGGRVPVLFHSLRILVLPRVENPELQVGIGEARVERRRLLEVQLDLVQVGGLLLVALPLPQSQA